MTPLEQLIALAQRAGATVVQTSAAVVLVVPLQSTCASTRDSDDLLSLDEARDLARLKTTRPLRDAARAGEIILFGKQRSRTVKRSDLIAWLELRRSKPVAGADDADIDARMKRLARRHPELRAAGGSPR